jgi:LysR family glycine cleavage system transcriptional activator
LLEYANLTPDWINWSIWLRRLNLPAIGTWSVLPCSSFGQSVSRALSGQGIVLANLDMLRPELADGRLVRIGAHSLLPRKSYYLSHRADKEVSSAARRLFNFLTSSQGQYGASTSFINR